MVDRSHAGRTEAIAPCGGGATYTSNRTAACERCLWRWDYVAMRLRQFASVNAGALVEKWQLFGAASLFSEAAE